jgi:hypothetical protein
VADSSGRNLAEFKHAVSSSKGCSAGNKALSGQELTGLVDRATITFKESVHRQHSGIGGVVNMGKSVGKGLSKIQNKAYKKKKK